MKIEKLNENRIKITFDNHYLQDNQISIHSFMSNSIESQALFLTILDAAEKEVGFITEDYKIVVEALTQNKDCFTLIISRFLEKSKKKLNSRIRTQRKFSSLQNNISLYKFENLEIFFAFAEFLFKKNPELFLLLNEKNSLYEYNNCYFLAIDKLFLDKKILFKITSLFSEYSEYVFVSENSFIRLKEFGKILIEKNAIYSCAKKNSNL